MINDAPFLTALPETLTFSPNLSLTLGAQSVGTDFEGLVMGWQLSQANMFAAMNATNEAILRTRAEGELFQRVCDAAVRDGGLRVALVLLPAADGGLQISAASGELGNTDPASFRVSVDPST